MTMNSDDDAAELHAFRKAGDGYLEKLRALVADRRGHAEYLDDALAHPTHAPDTLPKGCTARVARAISEDLDWIHAPHPPRSPYPHEYENLRVAFRRAEARKQATQADPFTFRLT